MHDENEGLKQDGSPDTVDENKDLDGQSEGQDAEAIDETGFTKPMAETGNSQPANEQEKRTITELLYGVIVSPVDNLRYAADNKLWLAGILLYVAVAWVGAITSIPGLINQFKSPPPGANFPGFNPNIIIVSAVVFAPITATIFQVAMAGIYHAIAKLLKGNGEYGGLIGSLGFASFPLLLGTPLALIDLVIGKGDTNSLSIILLGMFSGLIWLAILFWVIALNVIAIRENYKFSTWRAVWTYFIPLIAFIALITLLVVLVVVLIFGAFATA